MTPSKIGAVMGPAWIAMDVFSTVAKPFNEFAHHLTRRSSATAGGSERCKHPELFHKIKSAHHTGQRLAAAIG
jgi:hypothetical protein